MTEFDAHKYFGKYKAFVRDTNDPERRGRIRCYCPDIMGETDTEATWLGWAEACIPSFGGVSGLDFNVPLSSFDAGHEQPVWIEFEAGMLDFPIWVGVGVYAPTLDRTDLTKSPVTAQVGQPDVGLLGLASEAGPGSHDGSLNPPQASPDQGDIVFMAKSGRRVIMGIEGGAVIVLDGGCADIVAPLARINGRVFLSGLDKIVGD